MEKKILIRMLETGDIEITVNGEPYLTIPKDSRRIKADDIYEMFAYRTGDHYTVVTSNEYGKYTDVIKFFAELIEDISEKLNGLSSQVMGELQQ